MSREINVFDFCGTLVAIDTRDAFIRYILKKEKQHVKLLLAQIADSMLFKAATKLKILSLREKKRFLLKMVSGVSKEAITHHAKCFTNEVLLNNVNHVVLDLLRDKARSQRDIIIASAGFAEYIDEFFKQLGIGVIVEANELAFERDLTTGDLKDVDCYGAQKWTRVMANLGLNDYIDVVVTDHISDIDLLLEARRPLWVDNGRVSEFRQKRTK